MVAMPNLDQETVRRAIAVARSRGLARIEVAVGGGSLAATLSPDWEPTYVEPEAEQGEAAAKVVVASAPVVGYFRAADLKEGDLVEVGQSLGEVVALGISNEVASPAAGHFESFLATDGVAVEYGQGLARIVES
jgi:biotin carboxyl carrier protein